MNPGEVKKFEVFTTSLHDGYICDDSFSADINQIRDIIDQIIAGLGQLILADECHNDLKPGNILYKYRNNKYTIKIGDFGQCGTKGGTPGWTAPVFFEDRKPGKEDLYSIGLVILRLLTGDDDLFHCLRDNFVTNIDSTKQWMADFKNMDEVKLVMKMMNLDNQPTFKEVENKWNRIKSNIQMIDDLRLSQLSVPDDYLQLQYKLYCTITTRNLIFASNRN